MTAQLINRTTGQTRSSVGYWTLPDGRPLSGDLLARPVAERVAMGWHVLSEATGAEASETWDDATGTCTRVTVQETTDPLAEGRAALDGPNGDSIRAASLDFLGYLGALYAGHGIVIQPGMTFSEIRAGVTGRYPDVPGDEHETLKNMTIRGDIADELWLRWDRLCYHLGDLCTTERVFGQVVAVIKSGG